LGLRFLKHIERSNILLHLIEIGNIAEVENRYETVINEINKFNKEILKKNRIVVINKIDLISNLKELNKIKDEINKFFDKKGIKPLFISASENMGIDELKNNLNKLIG
jgi:Predicted GTPase